jgi:hypothetical protein
MVLGIWCFDEYLERRNGGYYVTGTRVSLDSIVYSFKDGESPETIRQLSFPDIGAGVWRHHILPGPSSRR